jgi:hypothetical protein
MRLFLDVSRCWGLWASLLFTQAITAALHDDKMCKPVTQPVMTCEVPGNAIENDWCHGALPKPSPPGWYGDVACQYQNGEQCEGDIGASMNECGILYTCEVPRGSDYVPSECMPQPHKPPCTGTWGECAYQYPSP